MLNKYNSFKVFVANAIIDSIKQNVKNTYRELFTDGLIDEYKAKWNRATAQKNIDKLSAELVGRIYLENVNSCDLYFAHKEKSDTAEILKFIQSTRILKDIVVGICATPYGFYVTDRKLMLHCPYQTGLTSNIWLELPEKNLKNYFDLPNISLFFQKEKHSYSITVNGEIIFTGRILQDKDVIDFDKFFLDMFLDNNQFYAIENTTELKAFLGRLPDPPMQGLFFKKNGLSIINIMGIPADNKIAFYCRHDRNFSFVTKCKILKSSAECFQNDVNLNRDYLLMLLSLGFCEFSFFSTYTMAQNDYCKAICMNVACQ